MKRRMPSALTGARSASARTAAGAWNLSSSIRDRPSGVRIMTISLRTPSIPTSRSTASPSTMARPSTSRPIAPKKSIAASRSSTTTRTLSIHTVMSFSTSLR
jgi:hypothetical protein